MTKRTTEQVHDEDGHDTPVASCKRCQSETEADLNAEQARAELAAPEESAGDGETVAVGEQGTEDVDLGDGEILDGEQPLRIAGHEGPLPEVDPASYGPDAVPLDVELEHDELDELGAASERTTDARPKCRVKRCELPEFTDDIGLCGGHWSTRPDLRKAARRD